MLAVEALYQIDLTGDPLRKALADILLRRRLHAESKRYAQQLIETTVINLKKIDGEITETLKGWDFKRLAHVDRAILRLATCELLFLPDIPPKVCINEGVELAHSYSTEGSAKFINAVLDRIMKKTKRNK